MNIDWIEGYCLSKKAVEKDYKMEWDALRYMIHGKMFAMQGEHKDGRPIFTIKLNPANGLALREKYKSVIPGYYMNKEHWNSIYLDEDELSEDLMKGMIDEAYGLILESLPKKLQKEILESE